MPRGGPLFPDRPRRGLTACRFDAFRRAAAHVPPTATPPPRRRAWLRIFVVRCGLPCDPPLGGHSCNGGMIPRFHRAACDYFTFGSAPVPAITRAEKPVLSDGKISPFPSCHCMCECPAERPD